MRLEQWVREQPHALDDLGQFYVKQGPYRVAETFLQRELAWKLRLEAPRRRIAHMLASLGQLYTLQGRYAEAESLLQRAMMLWEIIDCEHLYAVGTLSGLARLYARQGKYTEAEPFFQRALAIREQWQGREHPDTLATAQDYADLLKKMQREEEVAVHRRLQKE